MAWEGGWRDDGGMGDGPITQFADGPPWSEDEDLQSPVVSSRHRKNKSSAASLGGGGRRKDDHDLNVMDPKNYDKGLGGYLVSTTVDGSKRYYITDGAEANGPGGDIVTCPSGMRNSYHGSTQSTQFNTNEYADSEASSPDTSPEYYQEDQSRYSRDYQFTITSPDEEMHGKAVALYDFDRENENELQLAEGQIIWVSYRHGQGWLVAKDPKTQENGLVPEAYVRLLRDIEGGINILTGLALDGPTSPAEAGTLTQAEHSNNTAVAAPPPNAANVPNGYHQPVVSTFSTSSKDLDPYPTNQLGIQGQAPPQVVHYHGQRGGSQSNTPTLTAHQDVEILRRESMDEPRKKSDPSMSPLKQVHEEGDEKEKMDIDR